jgi:outer membrane receptor protein involved in Fe transport
LLIKVKVGGSTSLRLYLCAFINIKHMKKLLALALLCGFTVIGFGQVPGNGQRGGQQGQSITGRFYGKVVDASNKGIEAASVTLVTTRMDTATKKPKEVIVGGMLTSNSGDFSIEGVPLFGKYKIKITGIGYKEHDQPVAFEMPNRNAVGNDPSAMLGALDKDLGNIKLEIDAQVLGNVTVTASKPMLQMSIDRKIFNVEKNLTSTGGTAVDVMKNVPSVNVDIDGNVTLRNAPPQIFVDGRPTNLSLEQIPADAIESVEIITNPSAKFDASGGTAGILNIVMKKNKRVGYSGSVRANVDSRLKFGLGTDINIRQNKVNIFGSVNFNQRKSISNGITTRTTTLGNNTYYTTQVDETTQEFNFGFARGGFDYFIDNRNTLTINGTFARGQGQPSTVSRIDSMRNSSSTKHDDRFSNNTINFRNWGSQLSYKHNFPQTNHELTADITFNKGSNDNLSTITTEDYFLPSNIFNRAFAQRQTISGDNQNMIFQTDYTNPLNDHSKIEAGARASIRKISSASLYYSDTVNNGHFFQSSNTIYNSNDHVYAGYVNYSSQIKKFGYQLGLRAESSTYEGVLPNKGESFNTNFPISLFPSVFITDKITDNDQLQLNYSRRINRPNFFQLFPFVDSSDLLNVSSGNPNLKPEFTNSFELSYSKTFKNRDNFLATLYYKRTNDLITRYYDTLTSERYIINTFTNANNSYVTGLELISKNKITKFWDLTSNVNLFTAKINIEGQPSPDQFPSYFIKLNNSIRLPKNFSFQLSGDYTSKIITSPGGSGGGRGFGGGMFGGGGASASQGYIRPNYGVDAGLRYEFLKNKVASLSLNVNDIFATREYNAHTESGFFVQDIARTRDPQVFRLNFSYRFGKFDANLFKRKNTRADSNIDMGNSNL